MRTLSGEQLGIGLHKLQNAIYETDDLLISDQRLYLVLSEFEFTTKSEFDKLVKEEEKVVDYVAYNLHRFNGSNTIPLLSGFDASRTSVWSNEDETGICIYDGGKTTAFRFDAYGVHQYKNGSWILIAAADPSGIIELIGDTIESYKNDPVLKTYRFRKKTRNPDGTINTDPTDPSIPEDASLIEEVRFIGEELLILPIGLPITNVIGTIYKIQDSKGNGFTIEIDSKRMVFTDKDYYSMQILYL